jgi:hypothetical protein
VFAACAISFRREKESFWPVNERRISSSAPAAKGVRFGDFEAAAGVTHTAVAQRELN